MSDTLQIEYTGRLCIYIAFLDDLSNIFFSFQLGFSVIESRLFRCIYSALQQLLSLRVPIYTEW